MVEATGSSKKRKTSTPPEGYVCKACGVPGHWIQQCKQKKKKKSQHVPVAGVDPSSLDIQKAREMQKIPPPNCLCGQPARIKKVKRSIVGGENSRAIGKYFFFCAKAKNDDTKCNFARRVEEDKKRERGICSFFAKEGTCKHGDKCMFVHETSLSAADKTAFVKDEETDEKVATTAGKNATSDSDSDGSSDSDSSSSSDDSGDSDDDQQF